jgi:hypothetical protein
MTMMAVLDKDFLHFSQASLRRTLPDFRDEKTAIFAGNRSARRWAAPSFVAAKSQGPADSSARSERGCSLTAARYGFIRIWLGTLMKHLLLSGVAALALSVPAFAADLGAAPDYSYAPEASAAPTWAATFDIHGGYAFGDESFDETAGAPPFFSADLDFDQWNIGGAARAATYLSSIFLIQGDIWANYIDGSADVTDNEGGDLSFDFNGTFAGAGGHAAFSFAPGSLLGVHASYGWVSFDDNGFETEDGFVNVGLESAHDVGAFRLYGQGGYTFAVSGDAEEDDFDAWYGIGKLTFYANDNVAISGIGGYSQLTTNFFSEEIDLWSWGATVEAKPWDMPVSLYLSYLGSHFDGDSGIGEETGTQHSFFGGITFIANAPTLRERDQIVGLKDMNPIYGDIP